MTRIPALDIARTAALAGMVVYHLTFDLAMFGYLPPGTATSGVWAQFARIVAGSFLFLAGVSIWLAHGRGIRWAAFGRRLGILVLAAATITLATGFAMPEVFIYFGILHSIAVASVVCIALIRLPALLVLTIAAGVYALGSWSHPFFDPRWLAWTGFAETIPPSIDFEPVFPWAAPALAGLALARLGERAGLWDRLRRPAGIWGRALSWPGRHSLAIYLVHQPILIGLIWVFARITQ